MTGWIKMGTSLRRKPQTVRIASALNADRLRVVGGLHAVWCVFDEQSLDGTLVGYTLEVLDQEIGWPGFAGAMAAVGWLIVSDCGISVPSYEEHNGPTAKRRASESKRKAESRASDADSCPQDVRNVSASDADKKRPRVRVRDNSSSLRSEESAQRAAPPKPPIRPDDVCEQTWADWLALRKQKRAPVTPTVLESAIGEAKKAGMPLEQFLRIWCARGSQGLQADWLKPHKRGSPPPEPEWRRQQRERNEEFYGVAAARRQRDIETIDMEDGNGPSGFLGG